MPNVDKPQVRINPEVHRQLKEKAEKEGRTIGYLVEFAIKETFGIQKPDKSRDVPTK